MNNRELRRLMSALQQLDAIDEAKQKEAEEAAALEEHYRRERQKEIDQLVRIKEQERQVRRVRVAHGLGIPEDSPELEGL